MWACLGLLALAPAVAVPGAKASPPETALVFLRVFGDVAVEFTQPWLRPFAHEGALIATGSGLVIAPSGLILTNHHVVNGSSFKTRIEGEEARVTTTVKRIEATVGRGEARQAYEPWLAAQDADLDLAVLQVNASDLPYLAFGDSDAVEAGSALRVLGFPFGSRLEVGMPAEADVVPEATVTTGSLSAARADDEGGTRYLQTDAAMHPGSSGGPMIDEDGYVIGVVRMKVAAGRAAAGPGFGVPVNLVKDFLDTHGLLGQLPSPRLLPGVVHGLEWKRLGLELPDGLTDRSGSRLLVDSADSGGEFLVQAERMASTLDAAALESALLQGEILPGFVPRGVVVRRRSERDRPRRVFGTAGEEGPPGGGGLRLEYVLVDLGREKVVAGVRGPADHMAFNLGLVRRSLEGLQAQRLLTGEVRAPLEVALERVAFPGALAGEVPLPAGWAAEPASWSSCAKAGAAEAGLAARPPADFTVVVRALAYGGEGRAAGLARQCGLVLGPPSSRRGTRLGVELVTWGTVVERGQGALLLEAEAPSAKAAFVGPLVEAWMREARQVP